MVYSAHDYGPNLFQQTWFNSSTTPASLDAVWNANWGYLYTQDIAPVWVGEFGTDNAAADVASSAAGSQGQWFESLVGYLSAHPWMGWTYWALNGEDSYDLLDSNYDATPVSAAKQSLLASIQFALPGAVNGTPPPTGSAAPVSCSAAYSLTNSWAGGFQAQIVLANTGTTAISPWTLTWTFPGDQKIGSACGRPAIPSPGRASPRPASPTTPRSPPAVRSRSASPARTPAATPRPPASRSTAPHAAPDRAPGR